VVGATSSEGFLVELTLVGRKHRQRENLSNVSLYTFQAASQYYVRGVLLRTWVDLPKERWIRWGPDPPCEEAILRGKGAAYCKV